MKHKFKSGETVTLIANRKQLKSIGIHFHLEPDGRYLVVQKGFGGLNNFPQNEPHF